MEPAQKQTAEIKVAPTRRGKDRFAGSNSRSENDNGPDALGLITTKRTLSFFFVGLSRLWAKERSGFFSHVYYCCGCPREQGNLVTP